MDWHQDGKIRYRQANHTWSRVAAPWGWQSLGGDRATLRATPDRTTPLSTLPTRVEAGRITQSSGSAWGTVPNLTDTAVLQGGRSEW